MNPPLLTTKFYIPLWREESVVRARLLVRLNTGLSEFHKLTLVSAPAGYGKTTLIVDWLHSFGDSANVVWISLDESDNELVRFLGFWISAFQHFNQSIGQSVQSLLNLPKLPPLQAIMDELLNDLAALPVKAEMVIDDYHVITNPTIHEALRYFIEHQPPQVHLTIATREDPPLPLSRMRARKEMTEMRAHDLRFTLEEVGQFFNQSMHLNLDLKAVHALEERTEGWVVGLQLAALALQNLPNDQDFIETFHGTHRYILDYLAEEVLRQKDEEIRHFMFQTAVLEKICAPLCNAVTGKTDSQVLLLQLEQANLFIIPLDNERNWYRYHPLFADYLRTCLPKSEQAILQENASHWFEANDLVFEAVKYALYSGNLEVAANVIERVIQKASAWSSGEITTLMGWVDALPGQLLQSRPALCLHASRACYISGRINLAEKYLNLADQSLSKKSSPSDLQTKTWLAISAERRASLAAIRGDITFAIERAMYALKELPEEELYNRARAIAILGLAYGLKGDLEKAYHLLIEAGDLAYTADVSFATVVTRCEAALLQISQGKLNQAVQTVQQTFQLAGKHQIPSFGFAWYVLAEIAWERNEISSCEQYLMEGIEISKQGGLIDDLRFEFMLLAKMHKSTEDMPSAMTAIEKAYTIAKSIEIPRLTMLTSAHYTRILLATGKMDEAKLWAQQYQDLRISHQVEYIREYEDLTLARVYLANGEYDLALKILVPLFEDAKTAGRIKICIEAAILFSLINRSQNKPIIALEWLAKALILAEPEGFIRLFLDEGSLIAELLPKVRQAAPSFVDKLLAEISNLSPNANQKALEPANNKLINPLSEQELRVLNLIVTGKSNREIAKELFISIGTAKWHVHNVLQKLGVNNRPQAIATARDLGF